MCVNVGTTHKQVIVWYCTIRFRQDDVSKLAESFELYDIVLIVLLSYVPSLLPMYVYQHDNMYCTYIFLQHTYIWYVHTYTRPAT